MSLEKKKKEKNKQNRRSGQSWDGETVKQTFGLVSPPV